MSIVEETLVLTVDHQRIVEMPMPHDFRKKRLGDYRKGKWWLNVK